MTPMRSGPHAVDDEDTLTALNAQYEQSLRLRSAAIVELSRLLFNQPELHDACGRLSPYRRSQSLDERARVLSEQIAKLQAARVNR
jgi:hypothetical protein